MSDTDFEGSRPAEALSGVPSAHGSTAARCAIVGLGRIASTLEEDALREKPCTHAGAIAAEPDAVLAAGCDIDEEARKRFREDWNVEVYEDYTEMLAESRPDIVVIATYPESHRRLCEGAVSAGVPVVLCEKPLARSLRDARAIARLHRSGRAKILVNHERRYSKDYIEVRRAVQGRRYGKLLSVKGTLCFGSSLPRREVLLHDGTHLLDAISFLGGGSLQMERRFGSMRGNRNSAFLMGRVLQPPKAGGGGSEDGPDRSGRPSKSGRPGIPVVIELGSQRDHLIFELELAFEKGRIRMGNGVYSFERSAESPYYEGYRSLETDPEAPPPPIQTGYFSGMIADAVRCLREAEHLPRSSALDALEVMKFIRSLRAWR